MIKDWMKSLAEFYKKDEFPKKVINATTAEQMRTEVVKWCDAIALKAKNGAAKPQKDNDKSIIQITADLTADITLTKAFEAAANYWRTVTIKNDVQS